MKLLSSRMKKTESVNDMLRFEETKDFSGFTVVSVIDNESLEEIGQIYWSEGNNQFAFCLVVDEIFTDELLEIHTEMTRLNAERNKSPFCTFDE